jgi:hypothetical protein
MRSEAGNLATCAANVLAVRTCTLEQARKSSSLSPGSQQSAAWKTLMPSRPRMNSSNLTRMQCAQIDAVHICTLAYGRHEHNVTTM